MRTRAAESTAGPARLDFANEGEVDRFLDMLGRFERGELPEGEWRAFRLVHGTYGQRQEGDLSMLRAKIPQGILDGEKLEALAQVAERWSRGFAHVTTRQNVQFHFVHLGEVADAMRLLAQAGITTREACGNSVRNITGGPTSGVADDEAFDVGPYAEAMTRYLLRHPLSSTLPRKFKIAFSGGGADHAFAAVNDIGWHARATDPSGRPARGFTVTVAGGTAVLCRSGQVLFEWLPAGEIFAVAEALLRTFHRLGDRVHRHKNRLKFLVQQLGWEKFRDEVLGELEKVRADGVPPLPFPPEDPGAAYDELPPTRGPAPTHAALRALVDATTTTGPGLHPKTQPTLGLVGGRGVDRETWRRTNVAPQRQAGYVAVTVTLPLGDLTAGQLRALARISAAFSDGRPRLTPSQNVLLRWVPEGEVDALWLALRAAGLSRPDAYSLADVVSCPGAESCKLAVTQSRGLAQLVSDHFAGRPAVLDRHPSLRVHVSGCPNGCGLHHVAGIGFQGGLRKVDGRPVPQYFVYAGGGVDGPQARFGRVVAKVPARRVPEVIERLVALGEAEAEPGEPLDKTLARLGPARLKAALADLEPLTAAEATPADYIDLGETEAFRPETTEGECSA